MATNLRSTGGASMHSPHPLKAATDWNWRTLGRTDVPNVRTEPIPTISHVAAPTLLSGNIQLARVGSVPPPRVRSLAEAPLHCLRTSVGSLMSFVGVRPFPDGL